MIQRLIRQYINNYKYFGNTKYLKNTNDNQTDHILLEKINEASSLSPSYRIIERFRLKGALKIHHQFQHPQGHQTLNQELKAPSSLAISSPLARTERG